MVGLAIPDREARAAVGHCRHGFALFVMSSQVGGAPHRVAIEAWASFFPMSAIRLTFSVASAQQR